MYQGCPVPFQIRKANSATQTCPSANPSPVAELSQNQIESHIAKVAQGADGAHLAKRDAALVLQEIRRQRLRQVHGKHDKENDAKITQEARIPEQSSGRILIIVQITRLRFQE